MCSDYFTLVPTVPRSVFVTLLDVYSSLNSLHTPILLVDNSITFSLLSTYPNCSVAHAVFKLFLRANITSALSPERGELRDTREVADMEARARQIKVQLRDGGFVIVLEEHA